VTLADPRMDALAAISESLTGLSSDLSMAAREERGYVYYIGAFNRPGLEPGAFVAYAGTREDAAGDTERLMTGDLGRIAKSGLREEELSRAREQIIAAQQMGLQDNGGLAQTCALNELYGLGYDYTFGTEARMKALTPEQVRETAASLFAPERRAVSVVLPGKPEDAKETTP
jgi:zinc protease